MDWKNEWKSLLAMLVVFLGCFYLPVGMERFDNAVMEALHLVKWYAREHVILCLIPAFFIAGAIGVFISQASVMRYLGAGAPKVLAYGVASVSGTILAVCSCTVLPLFAGIYRMGAGLGPATAFLYSGPAINVLAIVMTARILGLEMGIARAIGAMLFSVIIGLLMHLIFRNEEEAKLKAAGVMPTMEQEGRTLVQNAFYFAMMVGILVFANFGKPMETEGIWATVFVWKWRITAIFGLGLAFSLVRWFKVDLIYTGLTIAIITLFAFLMPDDPTLVFGVGVGAFSILALKSGKEMDDWYAASFGFAKQILPLLLMGVLVAGLLLGRVGQEGLIPSEWIAKAVGGNSFGANFFASFAGALMYFATLTEVPILQGLMQNGMGKGPALALLLAGPALSLPNMLVIREIMGTKKTVVFVSLVVVMATFTGMVYGSIYG